MAPVACVRPQGGLRTGGDSVAELFRESDRLIPAVESGQPLSALDWCRVVLATEIVFASDLMGSGHDWMFTTGLSDEESLTLLRKIQRKMRRDVYDNRQWPRYPATTTDQVGLLSSRHGGWPTPTSQTVAALATAGNVGTSTPGQILIRDAGPRDDPPAPTARCTDHHWDDVETDSPSSRCTDPTSPRPCGTP